MPLGVVIKQLGRCLRLCLQLRRVGAVATVCCNSTLDCARHPPLRVTSSAELVLRKPLLRVLVLLNMLCCNPTLMTE
jgi:hypothetical protein